MATESLEAKVSAEMKIVLLGDIRCGKTAIIQKYTQGNISNKEYQGTIGVDYESRIFEVDGKLILTHVWDTSGQDVFLWEAVKYIKEADGFMFVYDITKLESFKNLEKWLLLVKRCASAGNLPKLLIGNKFDMRHKQVVSASKAKEFAIPQGLMHIEVSARSGQNVNASFYTMALEILRWREMGCVQTIGTCDFPIVSMEPYNDETDGIEMIHDGPEYTHLFKLLLLGSPRVGKTALRYRFCRNFYTPEYYSTAGFDYGTRTVAIDGEVVKIQIWDVSGDEVYDQTRRSYYKSANAFLIVYDVGDKKSFQKAEYLLKEVDMQGNADCPKILLGNKCDLADKRRVDFCTAKEFADGWRIPWVETSASTGANIDSAFMKLVVALKRKLAPWKKVYNF